MSRPFDPSIYRVATFPYDKTSKKFDTSHYQPIMTDNRASKLEVVQFLEDLEKLITESDGNSVPDSGCSYDNEACCEIACGSLSCLLLIWYGYYLYNLNGDRPREYDIQHFIGFCLIVIGVILWLLCMCGPSTKQQKKRAQLRQEGELKLKHLLDKHTVVFHKKRLRWILSPESLSVSLVELWTWTQDTQQNQEGFQRQGRDLESNDNGSHIKAVSAVSGESEGIPLRAVQQSSNSNQFGYDKLE